MSDSSGTSSALVFDLWLVVSCEFITSGLELSLLFLFKRQ